MGREGRYGKGEVMQLELFSQTAVKTYEGAGPEMVGGVPPTATGAGAKREDRKQQVLPALGIEMEEIANVTNLRKAFEEVAKNKGAPGPDGQSIDEVRKHLDRLLPQLSEALLEDQYRPGEVRRVWIPKPGGHRGLGIPNVVDRLVQQAVLRVMQPYIDPTFDRSSHGFRPGKSCHTAIAEARGYVEGGHRWVVDIDLEKFFDRVNHQRLQAALERMINDRRIIVLIKRMLKTSTVMPDGVVVRNVEGTPQGGPLSPLLSNIVLSELDAELRRRGHKFVRYADDCNIYVRSEQAGLRVMESISRFIEKRMRLKVNVAKSAVALPQERHFLGFRLEVDLEAGLVNTRLSKRSKERIDAKLKELTPRNWGNKLAFCIERLNNYLEGWMGFFHICTEVELKTFARLDAHIRRRLRATILKQWKCKRTIVKKLIRLGASPAAARRAIFQGKRSLWKLSHTPVVDRALSNAYFAGRGLTSLKTSWLKRHPVPSVQLA